MVGSIRLLDERGLGIMNLNVESNSGVHACVLLIGSWIWRKVYEAQCDYILSSLADG